MADFQIATGKAVAYKDGSGKDRLAHPGDEAKLAHLSAETIATLTRKKYLVAAPAEPVESTPARAPRKTASE